MKKIFENQKNLRIHELDSAGIIYPYVSRKNWNMVFRMEAEIDEKVNIITLKKAVSDMKNRFPVFFSKLKKEACRFVLVETDNTDIVEPESKNLCRAFDLKDSTKPLIRVTYKDNRIGVEFFHSITDGTGGSIFLKSLLKRYFEIKGVEIGDTNGVLNCHDEAKQSEQKDSFKDVYAMGGKNINRIAPFAYQSGKGLEKDKDGNNCEILMDETEIVRAAKAKGVTITAFLTAAYIHSIFENKKNPAKGNVTISIPVNLRKVYESDSLRNFALYFTVTVKAHGKKLSFDEILSEVTRQFKENNNKEDLLNLAYTNVASASLGIFKIAPIFLKRIILGVGYTAFGECLFSSTISNLGRMSFAQELSAHIKSFRFILSTATINALNSSVSSFGGKLRFDITSNVIPVDVQKSFVNLINSFDVHAQMNMRNKETGKYETIHGETKIKLDSKSKIVA